MEEKRRVMEEGEIMVWRREREGLWRKAKIAKDEGKRRVLEEGKNGGDENSERGEREKEERKKEVPEDGVRAEGEVRDVKGESRVGKQCREKEWSRNSREQHRRIEQS